MDSLLTHQLRLQEAITDAIVNRAITKLWDVSKASIISDDKSPTHDEWRTHMQVYLDDYFENQPSSPDTEFLPTPPSSEHDKSYQPPLRLRKVDSKVKTSSHRISKSKVNRKDTASRHPKHPMTTRSRAKLSEKFFHLDMPPSVTRTTSTKRRIKR